jgi:hypothetical protein
VGLVREPNVSGLIAKLWLQQGIVIPTLLDGNVTKIKFADLLLANNKRNSFKIML